MKMKGASISINYSDNAERSAWEKKWDALQAIWSAYHTADKPSDELHILGTTLEIKGRRKAQIIEIFKGFDRAGCFIYSHRGSENYLVKNIKHDRLEEVYHDTENTYKKFPGLYQEEASEKKIKTNTTKEIQAKQPKIQIEKLEVVSQDKSNRFLVVLNNNYRKPIECDQAKPSWELLFKIAAKEQQLNALDYKSNIDYLNTNKQCRLYTQTGCSITKILKSRGKFVTAAIPITTISEKAFTQRQSASRKRT